MTRNLNGSLVLPIDFIFCSQKNVHGRVPTAKLWNNSWERDGSRWASKMSAITSLEKWNMQYYQRLPKHLYPVLLTIRLIQRLGCFQYPWLKMMSSCRMPLQLNKLAIFTLSSMEENYHPWCLFKRRMTNTGFEGFSSYRRFHLLLSVETLMVEFQLQTSYERNNSWGRHARLTLS